MACREQILSEEYMELLIDYALTQEEVDENDACVEQIDEQFEILYINRNRLPPISVTSYVYNSIPKLYGLMPDGPGSIPSGRSFDPFNLMRSGILQTQRPPLSLTGAGVVIGFIDTGINYESEVFRREDGSSRILAIWDQTIQEGEPPEGFSYGTEYTNEKINEALQSENPRLVVPSGDRLGHGTAVASVAAGSSIDYGLTFLGAAPDADIVMVKLRETKQYLRDYYLIPDEVPAYAESDIGMAVKYLDQFAVVGSRPVVICIGLGTNWGDHSGKSVLARYLDRIAGKRNRAVVVCGGNEGNAGHHFNSLVEMGGAAGTSAAETVEVRVGEGERGFLMELWGSAPSIFSVSIRSPGGEMIPTIDFKSRETRNFTFIYERTRVTIDHILVEQASGQMLVVFRFANPTPGVWSFYIEVQGGVDFTPVNLWLPITQFLSSDTIFLSSSPYTTLTEPSFASDVLTPSTYNAANNSFYINSGRGFARSEVKPDFAAPGVDVSTAAGVQSGSCLSAAITAGGAAQFLQWAVLQGNDPLAQSREIKAYFVRGAERSSDLVYPNRSWGYGRLNISRVFEIIAGTAGT